MCMIIFSAKGTAPVTTFRGLPLTSRMIELEGATVMANVSPNQPAIAARHRLPVFVNLKKDVDHRTLQAKTRREDDLQSRNTCVIIKSSESMEKAVNSKLSREPLTSFPRTKSASLSTPALCGGNCDGVTCMIATDIIDESPCVKVVQAKGDVSGKDPPDISGLPIMDRLCPFHNQSSMWSVPLCSYTSFTCFVPIS